MAENEPNTAPSISEAHARLQELTQLLRSSPSLSDGARQPLTELVAELDRLLNEGGVPPGELTPLVESAKHLADSLRPPHEQGLLAGAGERLRQAALRLESANPGTTSLLQRIIDTLASIGI